MSRSTTRIEQFLAARRKAGVGHFLVMRKAGVGHFLATRKAGVGRIGVGTSAKKVRRRVFAGVPAVGSGGRTPPEVPP